MNERYVNVAFLEYATLGMSNAPLNLTSLNDEQFEDLIEAIFRAKVPPLPDSTVRAPQDSQFIVISVFRSGRGPDAGRDLLVTTMIKDCIASRLLTWVVQCKHNAVSGRSVGTSHFSNELPFSDVLARHDANGYLLVCSTRPSAKLQAHFEKLTSKTHLYVVWDYARVCEEVFHEETVMKQFFPLEYERQQGLVDRDRIDEWARQFNGSISQDALAALSDIVRPTPTGEDEKQQL